MLNSGLFLSCDGFIMTKASSTSLDSPVLSGSSADFTLLGGTGDSSTESFDTGWLWEAFTGGGGGGRERGMGEEERRGGGVERGMGGLEGGRLVGTVGEWVDRSKELGENGLDLEVGIGGGDLEADECEDERDFESDNGRDFEEGLSVLFDRSAILCIGFGGGGGDFFKDWGKMGTDFKGGGVGL